MAKRITELADHLREWEGRKRRRTVALTLVPIAGALGLSWYVKDRLDEAEAGIDNALSTLEQPIVGGSITEKSISLSQALADVPELRALPAKLEKSESDLVNAKADLQSLMTEFEASTTAKQQTEKSLIEATADISTLQEELAGLRGNAAAQQEKLLLATQQTVLDLEDRVIAVEQAGRTALASAMAELNAATDTIESLGTETSTLTEKLQRSAQQRSDLASELTAAQTAAEAKHDRLQNTLAAREATLLATEQTIFDLEDRILAVEEATTASLAALTTELSATEGETQALDSATSDLVQQLDQAKQQGADLRAGLENVETTSKNEQARLQSVLAAREAALLDNQHAILDLEDQLGSVQADLVESAEEQADGREILAALSGERDTAIAQSLALTSRLASLEDEAASLRSVRGDLEGQLADRTAALAKQSRQANERLADLVSRLVEAEAEVEALRTARADLQEQITRRDENLATTMATMRLANEQQATDFLALQDKLDRSAVEISALQSIRSEVQQEADISADRAFELQQSLADKLADLQQAKADAAQLDNQTTSLKALLAERDTVLSDARIRLQTLQRNSEATIAQLTATIEARAADADIVEREIAKLKAEVAERGETINALTASLRVAESSSSKSTAELRTAAAEIEQLMARNRVAEDRIALLQNERAAIEDQLDIFEQQLTNLTTERDAAIAELANVEATQKVMAADTAELRDMINTQQAAIAVQRLRITDLEVEAERTATTLRQTNAAQFEVHAAELASARELISSRDADLIDLRATTDDLNYTIGQVEQLHRARIDQIVAELAGNRLPSSAEAEAATNRALGLEQAVTLRALDASSSESTSSLFNAGRIELGNVDLFESGSAALSEQGRAALSDIAAALKLVVAKMPDHLPWMLRIDGHTDNIPVNGTGRFRDNWELSAARAVAVANHLVSWGIPQDRLIAAGFADTRPIDQASSEEARRRNRRVEIKLTSF